MPERYNIVSSTRVRYNFVRDSHRNRGTNTCRILNEVKLFKCLSEMSREVLFCDWQNWSNFRTPPTDWLFCFFFSFFIVRVSRYFEIIWEASPWNKMSGNTTQFFHTHNILKEALDVGYITRLCLMHSLEIMLISWVFFLPEYPSEEGHAVAQLVEALRYKSEDRGFDSRWCH